VITFPAINVILRAYPVFELEVKMAALTQPYQINLARIAFIKKRDAFIDRLLPRRCVVISWGLIIAGLGIPLLMAFQVLQPTFLLAFVGLALFAIGGVLALFFCGEI
jgi:hypothetical protein